MTLAEYIDSVGGAELARRLGVSHQLVSHWKSGTRRVTPEWARELEKVSERSLTREQLRPDIFG